MQITIMNPAGEYQSDIEQATTVLRTKAGPQQLSVYESMARLPIHGLLV